MLARNGNKIDGVLAANDGLAGAVVAALQAHGLKPIPLTGQDATPTGVQYILAGWQSGTVYKSVKAEAARRRRRSRSTSIKGKTVKTNGKVSGTPSILLTPIWVTKANYKILFTDKLPEEEPGLRRARTRSTASRTNSTVAGGAAWPPRPV